jgi:transcriptional regulator with XRE-family HTH domain
MAMFDDVICSLDARRVEIGLTKAELARRADMPPAAVRRLFSQQQKNPTLTTLIAIADALDLRTGTSGDETLLPGATAQRSRQDPSDIPPTIAELADTWIVTENRPDWTRLRAFLDYLALNPHCVSRALTRKPPPSKSDVLDAMLAGIAQKVAEDRGLRPPGWTSRVPSLKQEWLPSGTDRMRSRWRTLTPPQLLQRGIVLDGASLWREYQNVGG